MSSHNLHGADRKGTYRKGQRGESLTVPDSIALRSASNPDIRIDTTTTPSGEAARQIRDLVKAKFL
jgi:chloramphenicol 3-O-phosphotransferase